MSHLRLGRAVIEGGPRVVVADATRAVALATGVEMLDLVADWVVWRPRVERALGESVAGLDVAALRWLAPVVPSKLICIGTNYSDHIAEMEAAGAPSGVANPWPFGFLKPPSTTLVGHEASVTLPTWAEKVDWEAELAVVIGNPAASREDPLGAVFGYSVLNDLSVRDFFPFPHALGLDALVNKGFDGSAPMGPWIVPAEQVADPQRLPIRLRVNGELKQDSSTANMLFGVREIVAHYAKVLTLEPGDVLATGTPAGVGAGRRPQEFLDAGDVVEVEIAEVGRLSTTMAASSHRERLTEGY